MRRLAAGAGSAATPRHGGQARRGLAPPRGARVRSNARRVPLIFPDDHHSPGRSPPNPNPAARPTLPAPGRLRSPRGGLWRSLDLRGQAEAPWARCTVACWLKRLLPMGAAGHAVRGHGRPEEEIVGREIAERPGKGAPQKPEPGAGARIVPRGRRTGVGCRFLGGGETAPGRRARG